jgi:acetyl esterase
MPLDPESKAFISRIADDAPLHAMSPVAAREAELQAQWGRTSVTSSRRDIRIPGDAGELIRLTIFEPAAKNRDVLIYFHGGGWVLGSPGEYEPLMRELADRTGNTVVYVDYRLAPENVFPAALDDCWTATTWVRDNLDRLTDAGGRILVAGDSAGGNLAAVVAQRAAETRGLEIARQILVYPITDSDTSRPSYLAAENQLLLTRELMDWFWDHYAPDPAQRDDPRLAPLRGEPARGLAPALVVSCAFDVLRDEIDEYVRLLRDAGVPVVHRHYEDQMHGFFTLVNVLPGALRAVDYIAGELSRGDHRP